MLDFMRRNAQSWGIKVALGLITLTFVLFMGGGAELGRGPQALVQVGDIEVTRTEYDMAHRKNENYFRQQLKGQASDQLLKALNIPKMTLDQLVDGAVLRAEAARVGLTVPEDAVRDQLMRVPAFQSGGGFSPSLYKETLRSQGLTPGGFEETVRRELLEAQIADIVRRGSHVGEEQAWQEFQRERRRMTLSYVAIDSQPFEKEVTADEEALAKFYDGKQDSFRQPPAVKVRYLAYKVADIAGKIEVSDVDLNEYYDLNKNSEFQREAQIAARHILKQVDKEAGEEAKKAARAKIEAIAKRLADGGNFEEIAKAESDDPGSAKNGGDLGWFGHGRMVPELDKVAFELETGRTSDIVETDLGYHIIRLYDRKPAGVAPFDEVTDSIRRTLATQAAVDRAFDDAAEDSAKITDGATLDSIATSRAVKIEETPLFSQGDVVPGIGPAPAIMEVAFTLANPGDVSQPVKVGKDYYLIALAERKESHVPPLAEIREKVEGEYRSQQALDLARKRADELLAQAKGGISLEQLAAKNNLELEKAEEVGGGANFVQGIGSIPGLSEVAFAVASDGEPLSRSFVSGSKAYIFARDNVTDVTRTDFAAEKDAEIKRLETAREREALQEFIRSLKEKESISYDIAQLRPILGDSAPAVE